MHLASNHYVKDPSVEECASLKARFHHRVQAFKPQHCVILHSQSESHSPLFEISLAAIQGHTFNTSIAITCDSTIMSRG